ncbi:MAG: PilZ domain-containing protein [Myxococcales bacterium]|nr:PilZ domain-containing protein [Myxococcales bacterium]MCA9699031.1 PilZ domain-containing protein [Myxococcales bacterium]
MSIDRRSSLPRVPLHSVGTIEFADRPAAPCQLLDVSDNGLRLVTPECDLPRQPVRIRFQLGRRDAGWTEVDARLVRARDFDSSSSQWAMEIVDMDMGTRRRLRDYLLLAQRGSKQLRSSARESIDSLFRSARGLSC